MKIKKILNKLEFVFAKTEETLISAAKIINTI